MPELFEVFVAKLNTVTEISGEIYPATSKEHKKAPFLVYLQTEGAERDSLGGWLGDQTDGYEFNVLASTYLSMKSIARKVIAAMKALQQTTTDGLYIQAIYIDQNAPELWEDQPGLYRKIINVKFSYTGGS
ncbi:MAG: hypothetical protein EOM54_10430 [Clostridia bacterium]|nr:hypothetical protein [Clostridia bacterium]